MDLSMDILAWLIMLTLLASTSPMNTEAFGLYQRAEYHFHGLMDTLEEIDRSNYRYKRSTDDDEKDHLESMASMCLKFLSIRNKHKTNTTTTYESLNGDDRESGNTKGGSKGTSPEARDKDLRHEMLDTNWYKPSVYPTKVMAERLENGVKITFDVKHSESVTVARVYSFEYSKQILDGSAVTSKAQFSVDDTYCKLNPSSTDNADFMFLPTGEGPTQSENVVAILSICRFDQFYNESDNGQGEWLTKDKKLIHQNLMLPQYRILNDPGSVIQLNPGEDPVFYVDFRQGKRSSLIIYVLMHDWDKNMSFKDGISVRSTSKGLGIEPAYTDDDLMKRQTLIKVKVLREVVLDKDVTDSGEENENKETDVSIRVTLEIGSKPMSGDVWFVWTSRIGSWDKKYIINRMQWERKIAVKLPYKVSTAPRNDIYLSAFDFACDENGNKYRRKYYKNCTIECYAWGNDIKSIIIIKTHPYRAPYKSVSHILKGTSAYIKQDVGPVSENNAGTYRCVAVAENGRVFSKDMLLYTSNFTDVKNLTIEEYSNNTSKVTCLATGARPLNISIWLNNKDHADRERVDNKTGNLAVIEEIGDDTNLVLLLSTDQLRYPRYYLRCEAHGNHGSDQKDIYLSDLISNFNPYIPKIIQGEASLEVMDNGTSVITCGATGGDDMDMLVTYGGYSEIFRIDKVPGNTREVTESEEGRHHTISLTFPTSSVRGSTGWLSCGAKNKHGQDWADFNLHSYDDVFS